MRCSPAPAGPISVGPWVVGGSTSQVIVTERTGRRQANGHAGVLLAEPEMLVRAGLRAVIESDGRFEIKAEAESGAHALELAARLRPALAVVSTGLRDPSALEVARRAHVASPTTAIVLLARADDTASLVDGFR